MRARQQHTGGGDGDDFQIDLANPESLGDVAKKKKAGKNGVTFTEAQLDAFEQSEHFQLLDEVYVYLVSSWLMSLTNTLLL